MRLTGGETMGLIGTGVLEVRLADLGWGPVCHWGFNDAAAHLACRNLGYQYGEVTIFSIFVFIGGSHARGCLSPDLSHYPTTYDRQTLTLPSDSVVFCFYVLMVTPN